MKICLISFDYFDYDHAIIVELKRRNIEANHIDISKFKYNYKSFFDKILNFFNKFFLNKNIKKIKMEEDILNHLQNIGHQDSILVIRPDKISKKTHLEIKKYCNKYIAYIYDSCERFPVDHLLDKIFDQVFSFDLNDVKKYGFTPITNYIYQDKKEIEPNKKFKNDVFIIISIDERFSLLNTIANYFTRKNINFRFIIVGKKKPKKYNKTIFYTKNNFFAEELENELENSRIFLDLIRKNHNGLSFRVFEALAMQRKIITTNQSIKLYDFYNPNNILIIEENNININPEFLTTPYQQLEDAIYEKYTIKNWVNTVFKI